MSNTMDNVLVWPALIALIIVLLLLTVFWRLDPGNRESVRNQEPTSRFVVIESGEVLNNHNGISYFEVLEDTKTHDEWVCFYKGMIPSCSKTGLINAK